MSNFNQFWIFYTDFLKALKSNFTLILPVGIAVIFAVRQTDVMKAKDAFCVCANVPKPAV